MLPQITTYSPMTATSYKKCPTIESVLRARGSISGCKGEGKTLAVSRSLGRAGRDLQSLSIVLSVVLGGHKTISRGDVGFAHAGICSGMAGILHNHEFAIPPGLRVGFCRFRHL
jgi:hypothetical protein